MCRRHSRIEDAVAYRFEVEAEPVPTLLNTDELRQAGVGEEGNRLLRCIALDTVLAVLDNALGGEVIDVSG